MVKKIQISAKNKMPHFNISVAVKRGRDNNKQRNRLPCKMWKYLTGCRDASKNFYEVIFYQIVEVYEIFENVILK